MREGKGSRTAQFVAYNRALGHLSPVVPGFSDPVAERLLPQRWKKRINQVKRKRKHSPSGSVYPFWFRGMGVFNQYRTMILDRAIRSALPFEQLVILGAGYDSRAWRLKALNNSVIFEVDHPDTQRVKCNQAKKIPTVAKEIRYVPVDFTRDNLSERLEKAGHDRAKTTVWLWEGVTMYLSVEEVQKTLSTIAGRSCSGSQVILTYHSKENGKIPKSLFLSLIGEPVRSAYTPSEMENLANAAGWKLVSDSGIEGWQSEFPIATPLTRRKVGLQWNERIWVGKIQ